MATKTDRAKQHREAMLLAGDAGRAEMLRRTHAGQFGGHSDSPIYLAEVERLRRSQGGLHDRLRERAASASKAAHESYALSKCLVGYRFHAMGYAYER